MDLFGFPFHSVTEAETVELILAELERLKGGWVVTPNVEILRMLAASASLRRFFRQADLVLADGMPLVWMSRLLGRPLPERVAGSSLISTLSAAAAGRGRSVYLLGGDPGTAEAAAAELRRRHPDLRIAGTDCPSHGFEKDPAAMKGIADRLAVARPDIVFVALGCPKQERLIARIRSAAPHAWYLGVGISFSYLCGEVQRAPAWMRRGGLEWLFRLAQEPERLARRYLVNDVPFALKMASFSLRHRLAALAPSVRPTAPIPVRETP